MGRTYRGTHPWITFQLNLKDLDHVSWMLLGEAISKCEHISGVPLQPAVARKLNLVYLTKGVHATTQIEGNTLSEEEVHKRIEHELVLPLLSSTWGRRSTTSSRATTSSSRMSSRGGRSR